MVDSAPQTRSRCGRNGDRMPHRRTRRGLRTVNTVHHVRFTDVDVHLPKKRAPSTGTSTKYGPVPQLYGSATTCSPHSPVYRTGGPENGPACALIRYGDRRYA